MATTEVRHSIRSMSLEEKTIALAVSVVIDRIIQLPKEDRDDLFALVKELACATTDEDRFGICDTMVEILDGKRVSIETADLTDSSAIPERLTKWNEWVSKRIKDARTEAGLTQEQLAEKTRLPQSHISRIENAKHSPARATIEKIANALGKPLTFFDPN
ncbi:MAG TPA: helix-turn-helix transcriptional regulator [Phycisphaerales bacterium]